MTLPDGNSEYITATNYYQDVTYTKSNNNIRINKQVMNHDQIAFLITPLIKGETEITFTDNETETIDGEQVHVNTKTVVVTVGDGSSSGQPVEQPFDVPGNLIVNGAFNGEGEITNGGWIGDKDTNRWWGNIKNSGSASLKDGKLELEVQGNESYVEIRNRSGGYYTVTTESIMVEPNTSYILEYDYETQYISGTKDRGFKVGIFLSESSGVKSASYQTIDYVSDTVPTTNVRYEFTTPDDAHYLTVSPVIYGHTGTDKNLAMKAWVDNMSLVEKTQMEADFEVEFEQLLSEISFQINNSQGCTIDIHQECIDENIRKQEELDEMYFILDIEPKVDAVLDKFFEKYSDEQMELLRKIIVERYQDKYTGKQKTVIDMVIIGIQLRLGRVAYIEGIQDTLTLNNMYDIAIELGAGYALGEIAKTLSTKIAQKYGGEVAVKLGSKAFPVVGWGLAAYTIGTAGTENITYSKYCLGTDRVNGQLPEYYCGKITVNAILILGGLGVSHVSTVGVYKNRTEAIDRRITMIPCAISIASDSDLGVANNGGCFKWSNQDRRVGPSEVQILDKKAKDLYGYEDFHKMKQDWDLDATWDAWVNSDKEVYFKGISNSFDYEPIPTGMFMR